MIFVYVNLQAILGCHNYKEHKVYDPLWRHVYVPEVFKCRVCPCAEEILENVMGRPNLRGTTGHWEMVISLCPILFQVSFLSFEMCPIENTKYLLTHN